MSESFIIIAGATGQLGSMIAAELRARNKAVKALVRPGTASSRTEKLRSAGVAIIEAELNDVPALTRELAGASCVVSALSGLRTVILEAQTALLDATVAAKVPRFIPSDFSLDFTKTKLGSNRNLDLRREFHARLDESGIAWTSVLNGGFTELLLGAMPIINHRLRSVMYVGSAEQKIDFTTIPDVAAFTAAVAADPNPTPRVLRCAGDEVSTKDIAAIMSRVKGVKYTTMWIGSVGFLQWMIWLVRKFGGEDQIFPPWQGMQYMANTFSGVGKLEPLDNDRYPELKWTDVEDLFRRSELEP
ncbi:putative pinoresinol-lariciresinol reductase 3 [Lipomyces doorenjongii]